jgi:type IV secretory pathway ATPase VirB11/archaellum biosynthesis ATPase
MVTPIPWRKIYIEDAVESRLIEGHHQVRIKVDPVDERSRQSNKSIEIVKSLHRSPDYLILGEIQTAEHSQALFQAVAAGLRTIQTCHSDSAASLMSRWTIGHQVDSSSIALMDVIVTLDRPVPGQSRRYVKEIVEVRRDLDSLDVM